MKFSPKFQEREYLCIFTVVIILLDYNNKGIREFQGAYFDHTCKLFVASLLPREGSESNLAGNHMFDVNNRNKFMFKFVKKDTF